MYSTRRSLYDRLLEKTPEQIFINSLRSEFELSPAESKGVLDLAKSCLLGEVPGSVGKIKYICASRNAPESRSDRINNYKSSIINCLSVGEEKYR